MRRAVACAAPTRRQARRLHSKWTDERCDVARHKKCAVGRFAHDGVLSRSPVPGSASGRAARAAIAACGDVARLVQYAEDNAGDGDTLGCALQRLGELGITKDCEKAARREAVERLVSTHVAAASRTLPEVKQRVLACIALTALARAEAAADVAQTFYEGLPREHRVGGGVDPATGDASACPNRRIRSAALMAARRQRDVAWARCIWNDAGGAPATARPSIERLPYVTLLAEAGLWKEVWEVDVDEGCLAALLGAATRTGATSEGWRVWRAARRVFKAAGAAPMVCDLTALMDFAAKRGTEADMEWTLQEVGRWSRRGPLAAPDARFLLRYAACAAVLYAGKPSEQRYYTHYERAVASVKTLPAPLQPCLWEGARIARLERAMETLRFAASTAPTAAAFARHRASLHTVVGRSVQEPLVVTLERVEAIFDSSSSGGGGAPAEELWFDAPPTPQRRQGSDFVMG
eukprot:TRINITY_DN22936_c0_g1_i1.p1 TRINITY_DN22936_c0_g1~~TRINITY_DN22936_c0_g1_i1.p1  ORF type:complete len:463 (+),score=142.43 TRINITY_DN22936_c0_g1_i1:31-1419(+)